MISFRSPSVFKSRVLAVCIPQLPKIGFFVPKMNYLDPISYCRELEKLTPSGPLLGLSVNSNQVGLGISDAAKMKAKRLGTLAWNRKEPHLIASELQSLISTHSVSGLVIAHPDRPHKRCRPKGELLVDDITKIGKLQNVCYTFWGETNSTKGYYKENGIPPKRHPRYPVVFSDEWAASEVLMDFLHLFHNRGYQRWFETFRGEQIE